MPEPISVLHVLNEFQDGSITRIVDRIIRLSDPQTFQWCVGALKPGGKANHLFTDQGVEVLTLHKVTGKQGIDHAKLTELLSSGRFQIVHTHTPRTVISVWQCQRKSPNHKVAHLATKHLLTRPGDRRFGLLYTLIDIFSLYLPDTLVAVSQSMARTIKSFPAMSHRQVIPIPNGIPCVEYDQPQMRDQTREKLGITSDQVLIGYNGRISAVKRLDDLLYAFHQAKKTYPEIRLVLAGDGELRSALELLTRSLGLEHDVIWLGFWTDIPGLLAAIDIYAQTSSNEGLSLSILEAMSAGKPVISTRVNSADEVIQDGHSGILVPIGSTTMFSNGLIRLIANPEERTRIGNNGKQLVFDHFNLDRMVEAYQQVYRQMLHRPGEL